MRMKSLDQILKELAFHKEDLFKKFNIKSMGIFGSYTRNEQRKDSDLDILVEFNSSVGIEFIDLANYSETVLKIRIDLVSSSGIKPKYYAEIRNELIYV
jgi:predicted nucleotidyltransferase